MTDRSHLEIIGVDRSVILKQIIGVDRSVILKQILRNSGGRAWTGFIWGACGQMADLLIYEELLEWLRTCWLLKKDSDPWS
jgi:hypothetical protein